MGLTRSEQMSRIRGRDTSPELLLRHALRALGLRYRVNYRTPAGRADVAFPGLRLAVQVDGCFWHGCPAHYVRPRGPARFWATKLRANVERDTRQMAAARNADWTIVRYWEHEVRANHEGVASTVARAVEAGGRLRLRSLWRVFRVDVIDAAGKRERRHSVDILRPTRTKVIERTRSTKKGW